MKTMARARAERDRETEGRRDGWKEGRRAQLCILRDVGCPPDPAAPPRRSPPPLASFLTRTRARRLCRLLLFVDNNIMLY